MTCVKCNDTKYYTPANQRGTIHSYFCDACCKHTKGYWKLEEHYGKDNGKWCCLEGCGYTFNIEDYPWDKSKWKAIPKDASFGDICRILLDD